MRPPLREWNLQLIVFKRLIIVQMLRNKRNFLVGRLLSIRCAGLRTKLSTVFVSKPVSQWEQQLSVFLQWVCQHCAARR